MDTEAVETTVWRQRHTGSRSHEDGGRDWSDVAISQGMQGLPATTRSQKENSGDCGPVNTLILAVKEHVSVVYSHSVMAALGP